MVHAFQLLFIDCNYPKAFVWWIGLHAVMFYFLFADFYKQAYKKKQMRKVRNESIGIIGLYYLAVYVSASLSCYTSRSVHPLLSVWLLCLSVLQQRWNNSGIMKLKFGHVIENGL
jgi:hypothetical protein